jgi:hypothetical protein
MYRRKRKTVCWNFPGIQLLDISGEEKYSKCRRRREMLNSSPRIIEKVLNNYWLFHNFDLFFFITGEVAEWRQDLREADEDTKRNVLKKGKNYLSNDLIAAFNISLNSYCFYDHGERCVYALC